MVGVRIAREWLTTRVFSLSLPLYLQNSPLTGASFTQDYANVIAHTIYILLVLVAAFTRGGLNRHHQLNWPHLGWRHPRLDGPTSDFHPVLSPSSVAEDSTSGEGFPGLFLSWLPTPSAGLQFACATCETVWTFMNSSLFVSTETHNALVSPRKANNTRGSQYCGFTCDSTKATRFLFTSQLVA